MKNLLFFLDRLIGLIFPGAIWQVPPGYTPDNMAMMGIFQALVLLNDYAYSYLAISSTSTTQTATAAQLAAFGCLNYTGTTGGTMTLTTDTATNIIAAMSGPTGVAGPPLNGSYMSPVRIMNNTGSQITPAAGAGVTLGIGTNTIANGAWREYMLIPTGPGAVTMQTIGGGTI